MLSSLARLVPKEDSQPSPEDIFSSSLGFIFTDDILNQHGDPGTIVAFRSRKLDRELKLQVADPETEEERRKFAHYLWNAGMLAGELVGGRPSDEQLVDDDGQQREWWIGRDEEALWCVRGERVLELGAGMG
jgi:EEF1A N-terminal glycine/lysine methyltransferase